MKNSPKMIRIVAIICALAVFGPMLVSVLYGIIG